MSTGVGITLVVCALIAQVLTQSVSVEGKEECRPFIKFATPEEIKSQNTRFARRVSQSSVSGWHPQDVKQFYGFSTSASAGTGKTIAIVAAYDNPNVEADLGVFSTEFGLPACTTANGCFKKVNSIGGTTFKSPVSPWPSEICLDVQWVHAIAPAAKIILVLADTSAIDDMMKATSYASTISDYLSLSWGTYELSAHAKLYDGLLTRTGMSVFASSGDEGALVTYPSASKNVISVGGTNVRVVSAGKMVYETGWKSSGGGCSLYSTATTAQQKSSSAICGTFRGTPDVALIGDPTTGVSVYDSYGTTGSSWKVAGGTSLSAPIFCAKSAVEGIVVTSSLVYTNTTALQFNDIQVGVSSNDKYTTTYQCGPGYDLVTGLGSWKQAGGLIVTQYNSASLPMVCWIMLVIVALVY